MGAVFGNDAAFVLASSGASVGGTEVSLAAPSLLDFLAVDTALPLATSGAAVCGTEVSGADSTLLDFLAVDAAFVIATSGAVGGGTDDLAFLWSDTTCTYTVPGNRRSRQPTNHRGPVDNVIIQNYVV